MLLFISHMDESSFAEGVIVKSFFPVNSWVALWPLTKQWGTTDYIKIKFAEFFVTLLFNLTVTLPDDEETREENLKDEEETREKDEAGQDGKEESQRGVVQTLRVGVSMFGDCWEKTDG